MAKHRQPIANKRRIPRQARAAETVAAILEGAAQVLEAGGLAAFTTNAVAERAGVSIGTLYQYFADKDALIQAIAERELATTLNKIGESLRGDTDARPEERVRGVVRAMVNAFGGRLRARKAVLQAVLSRSGGMPFLGPVATFIAVNNRDALDREQSFVLSRALMGTIRAAVLEEQPFLKSRRFEDELVRMVLAYLATTGVARSATRASTAPG
jgi:AcrR family transcriptional regulator